MNDRPIRVGVLGAGAMGRNHLRVYRGLPEAELVGVADPDPVAATWAGQEYGIPVYTDATQLLERERPEAVSIAVPTHSHHKTACLALESGSHVLIEKPIAATLEEAQDMVVRARRHERLLNVGHIERYNPAIADLKSRMIAGEAGRVFQLHARRLSPFPERVTDVGVIIDLATHDIDIMRYLTGTEARRVYAETQRLVDGREDLVGGLIRFEKGALGVLEINWISPSKVRQLDVTCERGLFRVDYLTQDLYFSDNPEPGILPWNTLSVLRGVSEGSTVRFALQRFEPLKAELQAFLAAVRQEPAEVVSGEEGVAALSIALAMIESGQSHQAVVPQ